MTGHGTRIPGMHLRSLERFDLDSVLFPYNFSMLETPPTAPTRRPCCSGAPSEASPPRPSSRSHGGAGRTRPSGGSAGTSPCRDPAAIGRAVRFVLGNAQLFLNTTSDATLLPAVLSAAADDAPVVPSDDEMRADQAEFAITPLFDGGRLERI